MPPLARAAAAIFLVGLVTGCDTDDSVDADTPVAVDLANFVGTWQLTGAWANDIAVSDLCPQVLTFNADGTMTPGEAELSCRPFYASYTAEGRQSTAPVDIIIRNDSLIVDPSDLPTVQLLRSYEVAALTAQRLELSQDFTNAAGALLTVTVFERR